MNYRTFLRLITIAITITHQVIDFDDDYNYIVLQKLRVVDQRCRVEIRGWVRVKIVRVKIRQCWGARVNDATRIDARKYST